MLCLQTTAANVLRLNRTLQHVVIVKELSTDKELSTQKYENITLKLGNVDILSYEHIPYSQALKKVTHLPDCDNRVLGFTSHNQYIVIYPVTWSLFTCTAMYILYSCNHNQSVY